MISIKKFKEIIKSLGPGFIIASVVLGPGSITVASRIGSEYEYSFLWVIVLAALCMLIYTSMSARFGVSSKKSILRAIADKYGKWFSVMIGVSSFLSALSFQFGNNLGIGIAMKGITGINEYVWSIVFTGLAIILLFWAKNLYKVLEKLMMVLVMIMILAFLANLTLVEPNLEKISKGFIPLNLRMEHLGVIAALVGTTFALNGAIYQSYLVQEKGWGIKGLKKGMNDTYIGVSILAFISCLVIITSAAALYPSGIIVNSASDMAIQLESLFGSYAKIVFSFGLCAAAFSSLVVNAVMGGGLLADGLGMGQSMNEKMPKIFTSVILIIGMLIAVFFRGNTVYALILAQASSILAVPLIAIGILLIVNNKKAMGKLKNTVWQNVLAILGFVLICVLIFYMYTRFISFTSSI